ncbi:cytochrome c oxidase subunit II [Paraburkholderia terricola]|uniref:cytochrome c oxidase subunit II n=1 Tax=Paraburkholderia terricola TaxID=169427 RepID=UPI00286CCA5B|nr:cytochrome c oxidase subunit II [Paraburkholderia terricola]
MLCTIAFLPPHANGEPAQNALRPAGVQALHIFNLWNLTLAVCSLVFAAVLIALLIAMLRASARKRQAGLEPAPWEWSETRPEPSPENTPEAGHEASHEARTRRVVTGASIASVVLLFGLLLADVMTDRALSRLPVANALHLEMTGHQWWWEARYGGDSAGDAFAVANELHVPVGRPVVISLKADDVIHTFWVPNLHGKKDMIPGRDATIEFRADRAGTYRGQCAEFCGLEHALMAFSVVAEPPARYEAWAAHQREPAPQAVTDMQKRGEQLFTTGACANCHTVRGTSAAGLLGPDLTHLMSRPMLAAGTFDNTPANLAAWIAAPGSMKPGTSMPASRFSQQDMAALVAWLGTLQ